MGRWLTLSDTGAISAKYASINHFLQMLLSMLSSHRKPLGFASF